jgi:hypothetical protein
LLIPTLKFTAPSWTFRLLTTLFASHARGYDSTLLTSPKKQDARVPAYRFTAVHFAHCLRRL